MLFYINVIIGKYKLLDLRNCEKKKSFEPYTVRSRVCFVSANAELIAYVSDYNVSSRVILEGVASLHRRDDQCIKRNVVRVTSAEQINRQLQI